MRANWRGRSSRFANYLIEDDFALLFVASIETLRINIRSKPTDESMSTEMPTWVRAVDIAVGFISITAALIIVVNPSYGTSTIATLLVLSLVFGTVTMFMTGGARRLAASFRGVGVAGGLISVAILGFLLLSPEPGITTLVFLVAVTLAVQGVGNFAHVLHRDHPRWMRASYLTVGLMVLLLAAVAVLLPGLAIVSVVALLTLNLGVTGLNRLIIGIRPETKAEQTLVKLVLFALVYGFLNVNWIDLYYNQVPAYHLWLILTYMAPFGVLLVFQGLKDWELALSLGLLVSLCNDLGYFFSGDLFFGFHVNLVTWLEGQLGLQGFRVLFDFQGGAFNFPVTSILMGLSIYARVAVVAFLFFRWWKGAQAKGPWQ
jgi:uncharacterized membrane protein HdeD (DUF308 family)